MRFFLKKQEHKLYSTIGEYFRKQALRKRIIQIVINKNRIKIEGLSTSETVIMYSYFSLLYE